MSSWNLRKSGCDHISPCLYPRRGSSDRCLPHSLPYVRFLCRKSRRLVARGLAYCPLHTTLVAVNIILTLCVSCSRLATSRAWPNAACSKSLLIEKVTQYLNYLLPAPLNLALQRCGHWPTVLHSHQSQPKVTSSLELYTYCVGTARHSPFLVSERWLEISFRFCRDSFLAQSAPRLCAAATPHTSVQKTHVSRPQKGTSVSSAPRRPAMCRVARIVPPCPRRPLYQQTLKRCKLTHRNSEQASSRSLLLFTFASRHCCPFGSSCKCSPERCMGGSSMPCTQPKSHALCNTASCCITWSMRFGLMITETDLHGLWTSRNSCLFLSFHATKVCQ